jgi:hypothetical protein
LCDSLSQAICLTAEDNITNCLLKAGSNCRSCFKEILTSSGAPAIEYEFVARSGEEAVIVWQIAAHPAGGALPKGVQTYFYSLVRVIDNDDPDADSLSIPHESVVHLKSFEGDFTVYAATYVPPGTFKQGKKYLVKIYYFIPDISALPLGGGVHLSVDLTSLNLMVMRIRR